MSRILEATWMILYSSASQSHSPCPFPTPSRIFSESEYPHLAHTLLIISALQEGQRRRNTIAQHTYRCDNSCCVVCTLQRRDNMLRRSPGGKLRQCLRRSMDISCVQRPPCGLRFLVMIVPNHPTVAVPMNSYSLLTERST